MALRIARGLFRLWLVLSVLWIGGVGTVTWSNLPSDEWWRNDPIVQRAGPTPNPETIRVQSPDGQVHEFPAGTASDVIERVMKDYWQSQTNKAATAGTFDPAEFAAFKQRAAIQTGVKLALIPPVLMLALGSALGWAFTGFRRS
jgi:hypothetical protein